MDQTTSVIIDVETPEYKQVKAETSDGFVYLADLSALSPVYCFPKNMTEWQQVRIDAHGYAVAWKNGFEVHVDQVVGLAVKKEPISEKHEKPRKEDLPIHGPF